MTEETDAKTVVGDTVIPDAVAKEFDRIIDKRQVKPSEMDQAYLPPGEEEEADYVPIEPKEEKQEEEQEEEKQPAEGQPEEEEPIPENIVEAAHAHGFTDAQLQDAYENNPELLKALSSTYSNFQEAADRARGVPPAEEKPVPEPTVPKIEPISLPDLSQADVDPAVLDALNKLTEDRNKLAEQLNGINTSLVQNTSRTQAEQTRRIDAVFDSLDLPAFGKAANMNKDNENARREAFNVASVFIAGGLTQEEAIKKAANLYRDEKVVERTVVEKINKQKKRITARPGGRKHAEPFEKKEDAQRARFDEAWDGIMERRG
jgi:hypothetical protein